MCSTVGMSLCRRPLVTPHSQTEICRLLQWVYTTSWIYNRFSNEIVEIQCPQPTTHSTFNGPLTRYVKLWVAHASGMLGTFSRHRLQRKPPVSDPIMHHGTCVTHVPWCLSGSLIRGGGERCLEWLCLYMKCGYTYATISAYTTRINNFPLDNVGCNYWPLSLKPAFGTLACVAMVLT